MSLNTLHESHSPIALPVVLELEPVPDPIESLRRFSTWPHCLFLDSALRRGELGRYSFLCADPFEVVSACHIEYHRWEPRRGIDSSGQGVPESEPSPWARLRERLDFFTCHSAMSRDAVSLPPFQGGAAGLFSYDLHQGLERIGPSRFDEFQVPPMSVGLFDVVVAWDHEQRRAWIISQGFPELDPAARWDRANARAREFERQLRSSIATNHRIREVKSIDETRVVAASDLAPQYRTAGPSLLTSNFSQADYCRAVQRAVDYIHAGDVFQVNLSQRLLHPAVENSLDLYTRLRERNPATFAAFYDLGEFQILSASPERFLSVRDRIVEARPIKGTRQRTARPEADLYSADELRQSEKDRAENVMIVDLLRNDLSQSCIADSIRVSKLCGVEVYEFVQHLVSVVTGRLADGIRPLDAIRSAFPGGSITGAPKVRAMEIINELEPTARGPYCGSLGYIGFDGTTDVNILIRTITAGRGWWQLPVGGGIVAQSTPDNEYAETWHKARGLLRGIDGGT